MRWDAEPLWMVFEPPPVPTPEPARLQPRGDGKREYFRQRDRQNREATKGSGSLMGYSSNRARQLLKKFGQGAYAEEL